MRTKKPVQHLQRKKPKSYNIGVRVDLVDLARLVNGIEEHYGTTVYTFSAALRALVEYYVDMQEVNFDGGNEIDNYLKNGGLEAAVRYLVDKGLLTPGSITQSDRGVAQAHAKQYMQDEVQGKECPVTLSKDSLIGLSIEESKRIRETQEKIKTDPRYAEEFKQKWEGILREVEGEMSGEEKEEKKETDITLKPLVMYKGVEAERMERKARSWAHVEGFDGYEGLDSQMKEWFDDEKKKIKEEGQG